MIEVISVRFRGGCKNYFFDPKGLQVKMGEQVVVETAQGPEFATCTEGNHEVEKSAIVKPLCAVLRMATENDRRIVEYNRKRESEAFDVCEKKIADHGLEMKLVNVSVGFDGNKIIFYFTADGRVDFRELVRDLASVFRARIELRQIGVRDEAKMIGGLGICGRPFCCSEFLDGFMPVSIKMAKTQNLSLNPTKISGTCGRLMCCLKYEQEAYEDLIRTSPKVDSFVDTPEGRGTVVEVDLLRQRVKVRMEDSPETNSVFSNTDIAILRNGKAKKNDPPIPADLAPISGGGKRVRKAEEEERPLLEPIRFRYSTEQIVDEPEAVAEAPEQEAEAPQEPQAAQASKSSRSRRRRGRGDQNREGQGKSEVQPKQNESTPKEKKEPRAPRENKETKENREPKVSPESKDSAGEQAKKPNRRPNHRRHRKPKPQSEG